MILSDIIKLETTKTVSKKVEAEVTPLVREATEHKRKLKAFEDLDDDLRWSDDFTNKRVKYTEAYNRVRSSILVKTGDLQDLFIEGNGDTLSKAAKTPTVQMSEVRRVADALSFLVIPFDYMPEESWSGESWEMQNSIRGFVNSLEKMFDIYALAPVPYYSIREHIAAEKDKNVYAGQKISQAFMAVNMVVPMFRTVMSELKELRDRTSRMEDRVKRAEREIENLASRLSQLQQQIENEVRERVEAQARADKQRREEERFIAYEPMLLAVAKGSSLMDNQRAIVGPCWGPDFDDIVFESLGFKLIPKQRALLAKHNAKWSK